MCQTCRTCQTARGIKQALCPIVYGHEAQNTSIQQHHFSSLLLSDTVAHPQDICEYCINHIRYETKKETTNS